MLQPNTTRLDFRVSVMLSLHVTSQSLDCGRVYLLSLLNDGIKKDEWKDEEGTISETGLGPSPVSPSFISSPQRWRK